MHCSFLNEFPSRKGDKQEKIIQIIIIQNRTIGTSSEVQIMSHGGREMSYHRMKILD